MIDEHVPHDFDRIQDLFGQLSTSVFNRVNAEDGPIEERLRMLNEIYPGSVEEIAIWNELVSSRNRVALDQYVAYCGGNISDHAKRLFAAVLAESRQNAVVGDKSEPEKMFSGF